MIYSICLLQILMSISLYASEESLESLDKRMLSKSISKENKKRLQDLFFSKVTNLESIQNIPITFTLPPRHDEPGKNFVPFNPAIIRTNKGYEMVCRTWNQKRASYRPSEGQPLRNRNFYLKYDKDFNLVYEQEMNIEPSLERAIRPGELSDCRLFSWDDTCWMIGAAYLTKYAQVAKMALCRLDCIGKVVQQITLFYGPKPMRWEKNWMPLIVDNKLRFIYSYDPFTVLEPVISDGSCNTVLKHSQELDFSQFRGSAAPIEFDDGYLMMIHVRYGKCYLHRFLFLDKDLSISKISLPFSFTHLGIEFCLSMTIDHSGKNLVIPIGIRDHEAKILVADLNYIRGLLRPIASFIEEKEAA